MKIYQLYQASSCQQFMCIVPKWYNLHISTIQQSQDCDLWIGC